MRKQDEINRWRTSILIQCQSSTKIDIVLTLANFGNIPPKAAAANFLEKFLVPNLESHSLKGFEHRRPGASSKVVQYESYELPRIVV